MPNNEIEISLDIDNNSEIDVNIESRVPDPEYYTKAEVNRLLETKANVAVVDDLADSLDETKGTVSVQGEDIAENTENISVNTEAIAANAEAIAANADDIAVLNGDESTSGSVEYALRQAKDYTDEAVADAVEDISDTLSENYWTKQETAEAIANVERMTKLVVQELPPIAEAEENVIYLVPADYSNSEEHLNNVYDEYLVINHQFEKIGSTEVDLRQYAKLSSANTFTGNQEITGDLTVSGDVLLGSGNSQISVTTTLGNLSYSLSGKIDNPASGSAGQFLKKTADGCVWADVGSSGGFAHPVVAVEDDGGPEPTFMIEPVAGTVYLCVLDNPYKSGYIIYIGTLGQLAPGYQHTFDVVISQQTGAKSGIMPVDFYCTTSTGVAASVYWEEDGIYSESAAAPNVSQDGYDYCVEFCWVDSKLLGRLKYTVDR